MSARVIAWEAVWAITSLACPSRYAGNQREPAQEKTAANNGLTPFPCPFDSAQGRSLDCAQDLPFDCA